MKLSIALLFVLSGGTSARTIPHSDDIYYHSKQVLGPSVWHFSSEGLTVFGPTGSILKNPPKQETCAVYESLNRQNETETVDSCRFFTLTSDGHRYVWAGARGETGDRIEIFDIDTADFVGFANTCRVPMDLSYHASRQEMIVHCHDNQLDVLSSNALGTDFDKIDLQYSSDGPAGRALTHSTMGPFAFSGGSADGALHEIDLSSRQVVAAHALPDATGARNLAYSPVNRHVFVRPRVCCTCGTEGGDKPSCGGGRGGPRDPEPVTVTTGPNQGTNVLGVCGSTCEGSLADTIGVYEFDTVNKRLVGSVNSVKGNGATPQATADGAFILLFGNDGGKGLRVLKPGKTGDKSTIAADIDLDFQGGSPDAVVISDFAYLPDHMVLVVGSSADNDVALIDMTDFSVTKLALTDAADSTGGSGRQVEWVVGTDYVWVTGFEAEEVYILQVGNSIQDTKIFETLQGIPDGDIIFVDNYERRATFTMLQEQDITSLAGASRASTNDEDNDDAKNDVLVIVALVLSAVAVSMSGLSLAKSSMSSAGAEVASSNVKFAESKKKEEALETKTLGSKMVA